MSEQPSRFELARQSYAEALDATKHQDDKIGRFLGAIAFLTGGALVFFDADLLAVRYRIGPYRLPLAAWSLGLFLILVSLSVLLLVLSLATPLTPPGASRKAKPGTSQLFFLVMAGETRETWQQMWKDDPSLPGHVEEQYIDEALNIAIRADHKYARTREGASLFVCAMLFFTLSLIFSIDTILQPPETRFLPWTPERRAVVGLALGSFVTLMLYHQFRASQKLSDIVDRYRKNSGSPRRKE